ncbi:MAG: aldose epimerase family protein, partial [archaeon]|nr:aldose epimerase family protein [archaeon]
SSSSSSSSSLPFPDSVQFDLLSPHMDMGYPGELLVSVTFALSDDLSLQISYRAVSDRDTVVNLTHHGYFNLSGHSSPLPAVADHSLSIAADHITPVNDSLIPTGQLLHVAGTPFDFRNPTLIAERIDADHPQIVFGKGYDHNYVLSGLPPHDGTGPVHAATLTSLTTGIAMACLTTEPGLQLYTANFIDHLPGKGGHVYTKRSGICLESQHFPDSPNHPEFPSTLLPAGREFRSVTRYVFSIPSSND